MTTAVLFFGIARVDGDATFASPRKVREDNEREEKDWINADIFFYVCVCVCFRVYTKNARFWNEANFYLSFCVKNALGTGLE